MSGFDVRKARNTTRYQRARRAYLRKNPLCAECRRNGIVMAAQELDHIIPMHRNPTEEAFWNFETGVQGLCAPCHKAKSDREAARPETTEEAAWRLRIEALTNGGR